MPPLTPALDAKTEIHGFAFGGPNVSEPIDEGSWLKMAIVEQRMRGLVAVIQKVNFLRC